MTTRDIPTVDVPLGRAKTRPAREVATAPVTTASAPLARREKRRPMLGGFRFSAADIALSVGEIEADLRYGRD